MSPAVPYPQPESRTPLAFSLAMLLHGLAAVAMVVFLWNRPAPPPPPTPMTFEMVAGPGDAPTPAANNNSAASTSSSSLSMPNLAEIKTTTPIPATIAPPPEEVQPTPTPKPTISVVKTTPTTVVPKPQIKSPPLVKPSPKSSATTAHASTTTPQVMTAAQFQQAHGITTSSASTAQSTSPRRGTAVTAPGVNVGPISTNGTGTGNASGGRGSARVATGPSDEDNKNYIAELIARLQAAFQLPGDVPSLTDNVTLTIGADGTVVSAQRLTSSGNAQFDAAVDAALHQITNVSPPPGGKQVTYKFKYSPSGN